jgi:hypothetical protein
MVTALQAEFKLSSKSGTFIVQMKQQACPVSTVTTINTTDTVQT